MDDKVQVVVLGLSASPASNNAYALILKELDGDKRLPIIIGAFEAQAIALEMEGVVPPRPMTHDLLKKIIEAFGGSLSEVHINDLKEGTFFATLRFELMDLNIDARPSDAIALAVRFNAPIFINRDILDATGHIPEGSEHIEDDELDDTLEPTSVSATPKEPVNESPIEALNRKLDKAVEDEDYETAAKYRDEIKKLLDNQ